MSNRVQWLRDLGSADSAVPDGLVSVGDYRKDGCHPEEVAMMEKAEYYGASAVFFEAGRNGKPPVAQAFVFVSDGSEPEKEFAELHRRLWSWGGVPLVYRKTPGLVQLFRCAHQPDFESKKDGIVFKPHKTLELASQVANDPWWDAERLRSGTLWDEPEVCEDQWVRGRQKPPPPRCRNGVNSPYLPAYVFLVPGDSRVIAPPGEQLSRPILTDNSWYGCYRLVSLR